MSLKIPAPLPIFPAAPPPSGRPGAATEVRFSRWNNANAQPFVRRQREQQEIEDDIRRHRRHHSAARIADDSEGTALSPMAPGFKSHGTPSSPSRPSIPGKKSKYSKPPRKPKTPSHPAFRRINRLSGPDRLPPEPDGDAGISVGDHGIGYRIKDAPFEFQYSYTETPKVKPLALREPPFLPFGPTTMPRPWTGRAPLPASKKKLPEFDSFKLPPAGKKGVKPVQSPGPFLAGSGPKYTALLREEILGEPLTEEEVKELIKGCMRTKRQMNMGRDGLTHNMLDNIHAHWKRRRVCKIKCIGVCTVDMDNVRQQLEEKTGGKIIYSRGGVIYLFRGRNYNYRTRPRFPLMLWKPVSPVYPRLLQRVPEGLTQEEAVDMRKKGHQLPPICKLGKNGLYSYLVQLVREAFEECELVRINCNGLNKSDCRKIGAKLKDLVPCVLLSFAYEHILMWRGKDWKSSLPPPEVNPNKATELVADGLTTTSMKINSPLLSNEVILGAGTVNCLSQSNSMAPVEKLSPVKDVVIEEMEAATRLDRTDWTPSLPSTDPTKVSDDVADSSTVVRPELLTVTTQGTPSHSGKSSDEDSFLLAPFQYIPHKKAPNSEEKDLLHPEREPQLLPASPMVSQIDNDGAITGSDVIYCTDGSEMLPKDGSHDQSAVICNSCMDEVMHLLQRAIESRTAIVLNDESLDANIVYERSVALAKTAPPGPVFRHRIRKKSIVQKIEKEKSIVQKIVKEKVEKYEEKDAAVEAASMSEKRGNERKSSRTRKRDSLRVLSDEVPRGSLGVDELAKLLA